MSSAKMLNLSRVVVRNLTTTSARRTAAKNEIDKGYFELKKVQEHFQKHDGKPVFLKGSFADQLLYRLTVALSLAGIGGMVKLFYDLSVPKSQD
ncbi:PREDICTED: cytochrome c oxidase subunit 7A, mitochondrial-like [Rhagoletis zephyria]|uniref:cytochrome c oxidase subunit 7A, mitochondrial-like n=1 Tax=Rhagoletis zephyria TaxID=28612 RepID=UPI0008115077|nr:PREDICTED: cytochrome c oxidase subunit 7A, mitochondrial-like [Rhagoletis zephyria]XP_017490369.1 PREDICTED: cytochrome c oxidase subunit 7A, mitochondrial-like [Rhagoletis zephyria]XP_036323237.1 cytochrome c oxidase subunit 7A, mitochondrial [Rhagoletis pomonella]